MDANNCAACGKRVYEMEKMVADKAVLHKTCFKCSHCNRILRWVRISGLNTTSRDLIINCMTNNEIQVVQH